MLAFSRLGRVKLEDIPTMIEFDRVIEPNPKNQVVYDRMYAQFAAAKDRNWPFFHAMNKA